MRIITKAQLDRFSKRYPDVKEALEAWAKIVKAAGFQHFAEVKKQFNTADVVGRVVVFDIRGNHYRLIAAIHYNTQTVYILEIMTHAEYDKKTWQKRYQIFDEGR